MEADEDDAFRKNQRLSSSSPEEVASEEGGGMREDILAEAVARTAEGVAAAVVVGDEFACEGGGDGDFMVETSGVVETAEGAEEKDAVAADVDEGMGGVVGAVGREFGVRDFEVAVSLAETEEEKELGSDGENEIEMVEDVVVAEVGEGGGFGQHVLGIDDQGAEKVELLVSEDVMEADVGDDDVAVEEEVDGCETVGGGDNERSSDRKEDVVAVADVGDSRGFSEQASGIGNLAVEKAELLVNEDMMEADVGDADVVAGEEGIETVGGGDNGSGSDRKEDVVVVADEGGYMEFDEHVMGLCNQEVAEKVELMKSGDTRAEDVGVADVAEEKEENMEVFMNREEVIEDGGIDNDRTIVGLDDGVTADVDDSRLTKENVGIVIVVEGDGSAMVEEMMGVGSHDVALDREVIELKENEIENSTVNDSSRNGESMGGAVSLAVEEKGIVDFKGQINLAENEVVIDGGGESKGIIHMVDEIDKAEKSINETDVVINTGVNGAIIEDKKENADHISVGDEELVAAEVGIVSDDASPGVDEINETENAYSTEDENNKEVAIVGDEIDAEAVENDILEDKDMDVVEETQATEDVDRTEETDATEDTDMAEKELEKVKQRERNVLLNRKGGKSFKGGRVSTRKKLEEDVCFICFDGGELVLCDRRGCPKVYHPSCVNRDEAFFQTKGQWNCGWHLCSSCGQNAYYFCYTCTFSLCKGCVKDAIIYVVRGNKGFCDICVRTVRMIESVTQGDNQMGPVDFDDKTSWEYLFKEYYMDLKEKHSLSAEEIRGAKNPWKGTDVNSRKQEFQDGTYAVDDDGGVGSDDSAGQSEVSVPRKRMASKRMTSHAKERKVPRRSNRVSATDVSRIEGAKWATKELLDFVVHMKKGDISVLSQFDVQALLLEYIKTNKLRDPRRKSQIICDSKLQSLFGKSRVGHFEMLKLLESHFLVKDDTNDLQGSVVDTEANQADADQDRDVSLKAGKQKKRKTKKNGDNRGLLSNIDDYAAIDTHNITLIYLRRSLMEYLLEDAETFDDKVIGSFVRIRIPGNTPKLEMYRLVPIIGTSKVSKPYKVGKKHTDYVLEIQNFGKAETIQIDIISNQEFTQDECIRLKQSMKYGVINRLTVGDIQDKAIALQEVRVKDWLDAEIVRLSHLRDRASEKGHAKELRECVEKLQLLKTPQERQRRLNQVPEIHADPKIDPNNESEDDKDISTRGRSSSGGRSSEPISPSKSISALSETRNAPRTPSYGNRDLIRSISGKGLEGWNEDGIRAGGDLNQNMYTQSREREIQQNKLSHLSASVSTGTNTRLRMESISRFAPETPVPSFSANTPDSTPLVNESEKMWLYKDPSGKIQGPFSMVQLRKWNNTGYFPVDLRIWRASETPDDSVLFADALKGKYQRETPRTVITAPAVQTQYSLQEPIGDRIVNNVTPSSVDMPKFSASQWSSITNLPSPTPHQTPASTIKGLFDEVKWSVASSLPNGSAVAQSSTTSLINTGSISGSDVLRNVSSVLSQDSNMLMNAASALLAQSQSALGQQRLSIEAQVQKAQAPDVMNPGSTIQNLVQVVQSHYPATNARGWVSASASAPSSDLNKVAKQPPVGGQWGEPPATAQNPAYGVAGSASTFTNPWRPNPGEQLSMQSTAVTGTNWGVSNAMNTFASAAATSSSSQQNPNPNWMQGPGNTGWAGSLTGNANMNWATNPNTGRLQGPGAMPGWNPPSQGQSLGNTTNAGIMPSNQAPPQNTSTGWSGPGNRGTWMGETNHNNGRYRERGDYDYGGGRPLSRQTSFGGGGVRDQGVCWYQDEHGNCRRGASCKFRHTGAGAGNLQ